MTSMDILDNRILNDSDYQQEFMLYLPCWREKEHQQKWNNLFFRICSISLTTLLHVGDKFCLVNHSSIGFQCLILKSRCAILCVGSNRICPLLKALSAENFAVYRSRDIIDPNQELDLNSDFRKVHQNEGYISAPVIRWENSKDLASVLKALHLQNVE